MRETHFVNKKYAPNSVVKRGGSSISKRGGRSRIIKPTRTTNPNNPLFDLIGSNMHYEPPKRYNPHINSENELGKRLNAAGPRVRTAELRREPSSDNPLFSLLDNTYTPKGPKSTISPPKESKAPKPLDEKINPLFKALSFNQKLDSQKNAESKNELFLALNNRRTTTSSKPKPSPHISYSDRHYRPEPINFHNYGKPSRPPVDLKGDDVISFKSIIKPSVTIIKNLPSNMNIFDLEQVLIMNDLAPVKLIKLGEKSGNKQRAEILFHDAKNNLKAFAKFNGKYLIDNQQTLEVEITNNDIINTDRQPKLKLIKEDVLNAHYQQIVRSNILQSRKLDRGFSTEMI